MAKSKKIYIETNIEKLAAYYFKLAEVNSLDELEKTIYWKYFEQDKLNALRATQKREFKTKIKEPTKKDFIFTCTNCKKELGYQVINNFILADLNFNYENKILNIICSCGKKNSFLISKSTTYKKKEF